MLFSFNKTFCLLVCLFHCFSGQGGHLDCDRLKYFVVVMMVKALAVIGCGAEMSQTLQTSVPITACKASFGVTGCNSLI